MDTSFHTLIERIKSDYPLRMALLKSKTVNDRLDICKENGFNLSKDEITKIFENENQNENLINLWIAGGPCHTKCAPTEIKG